VHEFDLALNFSVAKSSVDEHQEGLTGVLLERLVRWGMTVDPDKKVDVFTFGRDPDTAYFAGRIDLAASKTFMAKKVIGKVRGFNRGQANFAPAIELNLQHFGWLPTPLESNFVEQALAFAIEPFKRPGKKRTLIVTISDGHFGDEAATQAALAASAEREDELYFLFLGVSNQDIVFPFLQHLGDSLVNVAFAHIQDVRTWVKQGDAAISAALLQPELLAWLAKDD
jgi:hypothetical protein